MAVKFVTARGQTIIMNPSFRVEGVPTERDAPSVELTYGDGAVGDPKAVRVRSRQITVSGEFYGDTPEECWLQRQAIIQALNAGPVLLYEDEASERYIEVIYIRETHSYIPKTGRVLAKVSYQLRADDPYWQGSWITANHDLVTPTVLELQNNGGEPTMPVVWFIGLVTNPVLHNNDTGQTLSFEGTIDNGNIVAIDCNRLTARMFEPSESQYYLHPAHVAGTIGGGIGVLGQTNEEWQAHGFALAPGLNRITVDGSSPLQLQIAYRERWL